MQMELHSMWSLVHWLLSHRKVFSGFIDVLAYTSIFYGSIIFPHATFCFSVHQWTFGWLSFFWSLWKILCTFMYGCYVDILISLWTISGSGFELPSSIISLLCYSFVPIHLLYDDVIEHITCVYVIVSTAQICSFIQLVLKTIGKRGEYTFIWSMRGLWCHSLGLSLEHCSYPGMFPMFCFLFLWSVRIFVSYGIRLSSEAPLIAGQLLCGCQQCPGAYIAL